MFKVLCINDKDRPGEIPTSMWIKEGEVYTVIEKMICKVQGGLLGFKLEEVKLVGCEPYFYYACNRFVPVDLMPDMAEEMETELQSV